MSKLCVLGLGHIGLPTAAMFARHGHEVVGVDVDRHIVETLNTGSSHISEPGLDALVVDVLRSGHLRASLLPETADAFIIAVPTPLARRNEYPLEHLNRGGRGDVPRADLACVIAATESIVPFLRRDNLVILESTSPPRTTSHVVQPILERSGLTIGRDIHLVYCPERVLPGRILLEIVTNDRVIGGIDTSSAEKARDLYASFVQGHIILTDTITAEMVKLIENTYRDVNIALANELALVAESVGFDIWEAIDLANRHPRVNVHQPGPGVGGHCVAIDPWYIVGAMPTATHLIATARQVNDRQPSRIVDAVRDLVDDITDPVIVVLGLSYKADVGDIRESPSLAIANQLAAAGFSIRTHDPYVSTTVHQLHTTSLDRIGEGSDLIVLLTDHAVYKSLSPDKFSMSAMRHKRIFDARNVLDVATWNAAGYSVTGLGRPAPALRPRLKTPAPLLT